MKRTGLWLFAAAMLATCQAAPAAGVGYGDVVTFGSDFAYDLRLVNEAASTLELTRIDLDVTKSSFEVPLFWGFAQERVTSTSAVISGVGSGNLSLQGSWLPGQLVEVRAFPNDFGSLPAIPVSSMLGVEATFTFSDLSTWRGVFADIPPAPGSAFPEGRYTLPALAVRPPPGPPPAPQGIGYADVVKLADGDFQWDLRLANDARSSLHLTRVALDIRTSSFDVPLFWASGTKVTGLVDSISGIGSGELVLEGDWSPGDVLRIRAFPNDFGNLPAIPVQSMLGVGVTFTFSDMSTWRGVLADVLPPVGSAFPDAIYTIQAAAIPEPEIYATLIAGVLGLLARRRRRIEK